jgi:hypothetical protein
LRGQAGLRRVLQAGVDLAPALDAEVVARRRVRQRGRCMDPCWQWIQSDWDVGIPEQALLQGSRWDYVACRHGVGMLAVGLNDQSIASAGLESYQKSAGGMVSIVVVRIAAVGGYGCFDAGMMEGRLRVVHSGVAGSGGGKQKGGSAAAGLELVLGEGMVGGQ